MEQNNMITIENEYLKVNILVHGAELSSLYNKTTSLEYLWGADPAFWNKKSPVLFPIIGMLKDSTYYHKEKAYSLARHGFAREMDFEVVEQNAGMVRLALKSTAATREKYPFDFVLHLVYSLVSHRLDVRYVVENSGGDTMYFSIGGHPAFRVPLEPGLDYSDYYLEFSEVENAGRWPISPDGLIEREPFPCLAGTKRLPLSKELFFKDALVFKHLASDSVQLRSERSSHGLRFDFKAFDYLGIWAFKGADFVCIEPWCGISDSVDSDQQLVNKEGIQSLAPEAVFERTWSVTTF